ncbi:hypothetical protein [Baekduia sp. Peel2402]|uniref:hypothetical protein n=1 Tax=Baekduia sp. Peel2402 TaxID=3458296 RepID=UPI00403EA7F0
MTDPSTEHATTEPDDVEVVDALPVPEAHELPPAPTPAPAEPSRGGLVVAAPVAVQAAAVAVTGFAAGAATVAVVRKARARKQVRARRSGKDKARGDIRATRSFLVDIHLLGRD